MISAWTKHLPTEQDKKQFEEVVRRSTAAFERLTQLVEEDEKAVERSIIDPNDFDSPSWAAKQAYYNGFKACLYKYKKLLNLDQKELS